MSLHPHKINPEDDLGFGPQPVLKNQPLINKDGSANVTRIGTPFFNTADNYHSLITMSWGKFWVIVLSGYLVANIAFASIYVAIGIDKLDGHSGGNGINQFLDAFFFSAQTISTVGYGHLSPRGVPANTVAAIESMVGLLAFALATGLLYGRFSRPTAKIIYSEKMLVAPYQNGGKGLMLRLANLRRNVLMDVEVTIIFSYNEMTDGKLGRKFFQLDLERHTVNALTINWTVVHPLTDDSPLKEMSQKDMEDAEVGFTVLLKAFDDTFSQTIQSRTSYQYDDIVWDARFVKIIDRDEQGRIVFDLQKIGTYEMVS